MTCRQQRCRHSVHSTHRLCNTSCSRQDLQASSSPQLQSITPCAAAGQQVKPCVRVERAGRGGVAQSIPRAGAGRVTRQQAAGQKNLKSLFRASTSSAAALRMGPTTSSKCCLRKRSSHSCAVHSA